MWDCPALWIADKRSDLAISTRMIQGRAQPGPDRGEGGKYLIAPPDYWVNCRTADSSSRARTNGIVRFGRSFLENHKDHKPVAEVIRKFTKVCPYEPRGVGTTVAAFTPEGVKPIPATGYRTMDTRTNFSYGVTGITPPWPCASPASARNICWR